MGSTECYVTVRLRKPALFTDGSYEMKHNDCFSIVGSEQTRPVCSCCNKDDKMNQAKVK